MGRLFGWMKPKVEPSQYDDAHVALVQAVDEMDEVHGNWSHIESVARQLDAELKRNHFAERFQLTFEDKARS